MVAALVTAPLVLSACAGYPARDYARAACEDLSALRGIDSPSQDELEVHLDRATARARRAADLDSAFDDLHGDLRLLRDESSTGAADESDQAVEQALSAVESACADLGAPIDASGPSA